MPDFVTLTCPSCGGKLKITPDIDRFACANCGSEHLVLRSDSVVALKPLQDSLSGLARATDRTASEMAIKRIQGEIAGLQASKGPVNAKFVPLKEVIAAHDKRRLSIQSLWITPLLIVAFFLAYSVILVLVPSSKFLQAFHPFFTIGICWGTILILAIAFLASLWEAIFGSRPKPSRGETEAAIRAVESELGAIEETIRQRETELARHRAAVSLPE
jgi:hypothetical protein